MSDRRIELDRESLEVPRNALSSAVRQDLQYVDFEGGRLAVREARYFLRVMDFRLYGKPLWGSSSPC